MYRNSQMKQRKDSLESTVGNKRKGTFQESASDYDLKQKPAWYKIVLSDSSYSNCSTKFIFELHNNFSP